MAETTRLDVMSRPTLTLNRRLAVAVLAAVAAALLLLGFWVIAMAPLVWDFALVCVAAGLGFGLVAWWGWRKAGLAGPVLVIRPEGLGLPQHGTDAAPMRLRWSEIEALTFDGPPDRAEALIVTVTAEASRLRGVAVEHLSPDAVHVGNRLRLRQGLADLSEPPARIETVLLATARAAGLDPKRADAGLAQGVLEGVLGRHRRWALHASD